MRQNVNLWILVLLILIASASSFSAAVYIVRNDIFPYPQIIKLLRKHSGNANSNTYKIGTALHVLIIEKTDIKPAVMTAKYDGGGISVFEDQLVGSTRQGEFFHYVQDKNGANVKKLPLTLEMNLSEFSDYLAIRDMDVGRARDRFGITDVLLWTQQKHKFLIVSHNYWHAPEECYTLRVSKLPIESPLQLHRLTAEAEDWQLLWESSPCLKTSLRTRQFATHQSGGKMLAADRDHLLLTVGDFGFDSVGADNSVSQDPTSAYGRIILIDSESGENEIVSIGHRNPQGLAMDSAGQIWSTEHGPQGGDELNLITQNANYGWPLVSYGTHYGTSKWPLSKTQGRHDGFREPVFSWVPSIAVSDLIEIRQFSPEWDGDLLVGSLAGFSLFRIRHVDQRVVFAEPIKIRQRVRDIEQLSNGTIVVLADGGTLLSISIARTPEDPVNVWMPPQLDEAAQSMVMSIVSDCIECHSVSPMGPQQTAPNLYGIYGKQIAASSYGVYSDSLRRRKGAWDYETLDTFLEDGETFAPGNHMRYAEIKDSSIRQGVIRYLQQLER